MRTYVKTLEVLGGRLRSRQLPGNEAHSAFIVRFNGIVEQLKATEYIASQEGGLPVQRAFNRLNTLTDAAESWLFKNNAETEAAFEKTLRAKAGFEPGLYGPELRSRIQAMSPGDRVKAVYDFIKARDGQSLAAILDAPSVLTGLSAEEMGKFREQYYQAAAPDLVQARDTYRDLSGHLQAAITTARKASLEHSDPAKLKELEAREAAIKAAEGE